MSKTENRGFSSYFLFAIFALSFIGYQLVQDVIRPSYDGNNDVIAYVLGIAPNFLPAIGLPCLFLLVLREWTKRSKALQVFQGRPELLANGLSLFGLLLWEFAQTYTSRGHFDWHDVLWTLIGGVVFYFIWRINDNQQE
jgi:hypothetical protein